MSKNDIKYFIYARKSTESDGRQILSIPAQIEDALRLQERERLAVIDTLTDSASAKIPFNRGNYSAMIKRIKRGEASGIIVWKIDRLARNHLEGGELIHLLQTGVIRSIWTLHREYQSRDSALLISLEASMASQYSVDLAENVTRGLYKKVSTGQPPIIAPPGYSNTKRIESGTNSIVAAPKRWAPMRKAFDLMLTGQYSIGRIAAIMNGELNFRTRSSRMRSGSPISTSMLHRALINPFYAGYFKYKGTLYEGSYKPMITLEEFDKIQEILGRKGRAKEHKHQFAFTGFIRCGCCGCAVTASRKLKRIKATGEYRTYTFYHCTKRKGSAACGDKHYTTEQEMAAMIGNELQKLALVPLWKQWAFETVKDDYEDELAKQTKLLKATQEYESKLKAELDTLLDLRISSVLTDETYAQKKAEREALLMRVQEKYRRIEKGLNDWDGTG
jgi:site-specific DNA recombinase